MLFMLVACSMRPGVFLMSAPLFNRRRKHAGRDHLGGVDVEEDAVDLAEHHAELEDRVADRGRVDDRHHLLEVFAHQPVEQDGVAVAQPAQVGELLQRVARGEEALVRAVKLALQRGGVGGQQADEAEPAALLGRERRAAVQPRDA